MGFRRMLVAAALAILGASVTAQDDGFCPDAGIVAAEVPGTINSPVQKEISGVCFSPQLVNEEEVLWVMSDSNNPAILEAFLTSGGASIARVDITAALIDSDPDVEDLAIGPCTFDASQVCLFVGDTGNNAAASSRGVNGRLVTFVYQFPEPSLGAVVSPGSPLLFDTTDVDVTSVAVTFNQAGITTAEVEALMVDPISGDIFLVTHFVRRADRSLVRLFKIDKADFIDGALLTLEPESALNDDLVANEWSKGDISKDGSTIVLGTSRQGFFWVRDVEGGQSVADAFNQQACFRGLGQPSSGVTHEAIAFGFKATIVFEIADNQVNPDIHETTLIGFGLEEEDVVEQEEEEQDGDEDEDEGEDEDEEEDEVQQNNDEDGEILSEAAFASIVAGSSFVVFGGLFFVRGLARGRRRSSKDGSRELKDAEVKPYPYAQEFTPPPANGYNGGGGVQAMYQNSGYDQQQQDHDQQPTNGYSGSGGQAMFQNPGYGQQHQEQQLSNEYNGGGGQSLAPKPPPRSAAARLFQQTMFPSQGSSQEDQQEQQQPQQAQNQYYQPQQQQQQQQQHQQQQQQQPPPQQQQYPAPNGRGRMSALNPLAYRD